MNLLCPSCRGPAQLAVPCPACGCILRESGGVLRALAPDRAAFYARFLEEYGRIRHAEGRGSKDPAYYRALPFAAGWQWKMRGTTFRYFQSRMLNGRALDVLDLGAGNAWLSYRLAQAGHRPVAVDVFTDRLDGLEAARHYDLKFPLVEAEFDRLPFAPGQFDLAVFNSSLHYSADYRRTLAEALRCLRPSGRIAVLDSPVYQRREHGERMREERHRQFEAAYGFRSDSLPSVEFLWPELLGDLARELKLQWQIYRPWYGWKWHVRPWKARLLRRRPPSRFWILVGSARA